MSTSWASHMAQIKNYFWLTKLRLTGILSRWEFRFRTRMFSGVAGAKSNHPKLHRKLTKNGLVGFDEFARRVELDEFHFLRR